MPRARLSAPLAATVLGSCTLLLPFPPPEIESVEAGTCRDGEDNDFDGLTDWEDPDCVLDESEAAMCEDGRDNDGDGRIDYEDPGCWRYARAVVERCTRVAGIDDLRPFEEPGDFWAGAGTLVDQGDGFGLEADASGERALILIPPITGAARSLRVVLDLTLTGEAFDSPGEPILTVVRARDVGSDVRPDLQTEQKLVIMTALEDAHGEPLGLVAFSNSTTGGGGAIPVGTAEPADAQLTLFITDTGQPRLRIETATEWAERSSGEPVPWSPIDALRLIWSAPAGVRVRSLRVHTDPADTCGTPPDLLAPPFSEPRALAHGRGTTCLVLANPTRESQATTQLGRSPDEGATWEAIANDPQVTGLNSCGGILWDDALGVFRAACTPPTGGGLVLGESSDCGRNWRRAGAPPGLTEVSRALGYTMLGERHELWWGSQDGLVRQWTDDPTLSTALARDEPEMLVLEDGTPLVADGVRVSLTRVGSDRLFVRSDGVDVSLVVATAVAGEPAHVATVIDPLISPSGIAGTFDSGLLSFGSATLVPSSQDEAARLLVVYAGSTHCADGVCGQHASTARVSIFPP